MSTTSTKRSKLAKVIVGQLDNMCYCCDVILSTQHHLWSALANHVQVEQIMLFEVNPRGNKYGSGTC